MVEFPPFRLDVDEERLWRGQQLLAVRRKPFAILRYLVKNPRRLVTQAELLENVWGGLAVSDSAIRSHLHELRQILGEGVIETVIGRGYRFVASLSDATPVTAPVAAERQERLVVGRAAQLEVLRGAFERARSGHRQVCFMTGEPGIGKTTLVDALADELEDRGVLVARGHCIEQHGTPEAYMPIIGVLGQLVRSDRGKQVVNAFVRYAPTFVARLPNLITDEQLADVSRRAGADSEQRMKRELLDAFEAISGEEPLVIAFEDLQWSDLATLDLLALLAQRRERAQLLVLATSRAAEAQTPSHPLNRVMRSLVGRAGATSITLERIETGAIQDLLDRRLPGHRLPAALTGVLDRITGGTPLFLATLVDELIARDIIRREDGHWQLAVSVDVVAAHRPDGVRQLIDIQLDRLTVEEQRVLEAGSVVGLEFTAAIVAAVLETSAEHVDELCDALARRRLFVAREASEPLRDGSVSSRYAFRHGLVREVCLDRTALARRQRWHKLVAEELERIHAGALDDVALAIATQLEQAQLPARAIDYYVRAAERTAKRLASGDALAAYGRALELVTRLPPGPERDARELQVLLETGLIVIRSTPDPSRERTRIFERSVELARASNARTLYAALANLLLRQNTLAQHVEARAVAAEMYALAAAHDIPADLRAYGETVHAVEQMFVGNMASASAIYERLVGMVPKGQEPTAHDAVIRSFIGTLEFLQGRVTRGLAEMRAAVELVRPIQDPMLQGLVNLGLCRVLLLHRAPRTEIERLVTHVESLRDAGLSVTYECGVVRRWLDAHDRPVTEAEANALIASFGVCSESHPGGTTVIALPILDILERSGHHALARTLAAERLAFIERTEERLLEPVFRVRLGDLLDGDAALAEYRLAVERARAMGARTFELRALLRLASRTGDRRELSALLASWTDPCPDLDDARALAR